MNQAVEGIDRAAQRSASRTSESYEDPSSWVCIGLGSFGKVYKVKVVGVDDDDCWDAVKVVDVGDGEGVESLRQEVSVLRALDSPYIVGFRGCFISEQGICVAMEYCGGGSLEPLIGRLEEDLVVVCVRSAVLGLAYLHKERVLHRDVKAANILLTEKGGVKLADFGVSRAAVRSMRRTFTGSPYWMAPETILDQPYDGRADVWGLGITTIELATGAPPHFRSATMLAMQKIAKGPAPELPVQPWSQDMRDFVRLCCTKSIDERWTSASAAQHSWVASASSDGRPLLDVPRRRPSAPAVSLLSPAAQFGPLSSPTCGPQQFLKPPSPEPGDGGSLSDQTFVKLSESNATFVQLDFSFASKKLPSPARDVPRRRGPRPAASTPWSPPDLSSPCPDEGLTCTSSTDYIPLPAPRLPAPRGSTEVDGRSGSSQRRPRGPRRPREECLV